MLVRGSNEVLCKKNSQKSKLEWKAWDPAQAAILIFWLHRKYDTER
jgi:hypothetical protein